MLGPSFEFQCYIFILQSKMIIKSKVIRHIQQGLAFYLSANKQNKKIKFDQQSSNNKTLGVKPVNQNNKQLNDKKAINTQQHKPINWKKYGMELSHIFQSKKIILDIDLAFIAKKVGLKEIVLTQQLISVLKIHVKNLKEVSFSLLPQLLDFTFSIGIVNPPQLFLNTYLDYYRVNTFSIQQNQELRFPSYFLKKVAYQTLLICANKNYDQLSVALRHFGGIISLNQMKKIDQLCSKNVKKMNTQQIVKLLNIFRQIRKRGTFCQVSYEILIDKQSQLTSKSMIMTIISFLQLGNRDGFAHLQSNITERIKSNSFSIEETISIMHILHKYKVGNLLTWEGLSNYLITVDKKIKFEHLFAIMSGLSRNYKINYELLIQLIQYEPTLKYAVNLKQKQFVEFYFVIYAHFASLPSILKSKYSNIIIPSIIGNDQKSVYTQIKYFFLFLFDSDSSNKKQYLKKTYPNDTLLSLLSHIYSVQNIDKRQKQQYQQDILSRYKQQQWVDHKEVIVAEQFIRYKLMLTLKEQMNS